MEEKFTGIAIICAAKIPFVDLTERPCYYSGARRIKGSYVRVGDADLPMTDYEIYTYEIFRKHQHDDERTIERAKLSLLDQDAARFLDNKRIEEILPEMLSEAISFCKRNMKVSTIIDPQTGERRDKTEYPIEAIREAVLNALIHRDYSHYTEGTPVQIDFFTDRMEIHSPGGL